MLLATSQIMLKTGVIVQCIAFRVLTNAGHNCMWNIITEKLITGKLITMKIRHKYANELINMHVALVDSPSMNNIYT